jgi:hypothetical protein
MNKDGDINFTQRGVREILRWNPKQDKNFPELKKDIKNAQNVGTRKNIDENKKYLNDFDVYRGKNGEHLIANYDDKNRNYYFTNDEIPSSTVQTTSLTSAKDFNNSITDNAENVNPLVDKKTKMPAIDREKIQYHNEHTAQEAEKQIKNEIGELKNSENKKHRYTL